MRKAQGQEIRNPDANSGSPTNWVALKKEKNYEKEASVLKYINTSGRIFRTII